MDQLNPGESSGCPSVLVKRGRGRPRKDPSLKHTEVGHTPPGFVRKEYVPQKANRANGIDVMVGQPVTGVVEASFDAGYLISVRIGNADTNLRGVVFKPGHCIPVTAANDIAPHIEMIRRNDVHLPSRNKVWSRGQEGAIVPSKRKHSSKVTPFSPPVGVRGNIVPVLLQPVNFSSGSPVSYQTPASALNAGNKMDFEDTDEDMFESLPMLPEDPSVPINQILVTSHPNNTGSFDEEALDSKLKENGKFIRSTDFDTSSSPQPANIQIENGKETVNSITEDSSLVSIPELVSTMEPDSVESLQTELASIYGTGRMTELLMAVHENMKEADICEFGAANANS